jgi:hypothetical protein
VILLTAGTADKIQVVSSAAGTLHVWGSYIDLASGSVTASRISPLVVSTAATTDVVAGAASTSRAVKRISVRNAHATVTNTVTLQFTDGTTTVTLASTPLAPGETLIYDEDRDVRVLDARGAERTPIAPLAAVSAGPVVANGVDTFRTGTAGSTGDTTRVQLTSAKAQTGVTDTGYYEFTAILAAHGSGTTGVLVGGYQMSHRLTTTGLAAQVADGDQGVSSGFDSTASNLILSLSVNPGASSSWTMYASTIVTNLAA